MIHAEWGWEGGGGGMVCFRLTTTTFTSLSLLSSLNWNFLSSPSGSKRDPEEVEPVPGQPSHEHEVTAPRFEDLLLLPVPI